MRVLTDQRIEGQIHEIIGLASHHLPYGVFEDLFMPGPSSSLGRPAGRAAQFHDKITQGFERTGALFNTSFYKELPGPWQCYLKECVKETRKTALFLLNTIVQNDHLEVGTEALELARLYGSCHPDSISQVYYQLTHETLNQKDILALPENLMHFEYEPVLTSYDQLLMMGGEAHE